MLKYDDSFCKDIIKDAEKMDKDKITKKIQECQQNNQFFQAACYKLMFEYSKHISPILMSNKKYYSKKLLDSIENNESTYYKTRFDNYKTRFDNYYDEEDVICLDSRTYF